MQERSAERPSSQLPSQQHLHGLSEQGPPVLDVAASPRLRRLAKASRQGHDHFLYRFGRLACLVGTPVA
jgi:hypothetical protein